MSRRRRRQRQPNEADARWVRRLQGRETPADLMAAAEESAEAERRRTEDVGQVDGILAQLAGDALPPPENAPPAINPDDAPLPPPAEVPPPEPCPELDEFHREIQKERTDGNLAEGRD